MHIKNFLKWISLKESLHSKVGDPPLLHEGEIWWASLGENIGYEINGKSNRFTRPVIIYKKLAKGFYFVIPTTTQNQTGSWYVSFKFKGKAEIACLHQARSIDYRRLHSRLGRLDDLDYEKIKMGFRALY